jgi:glycosyltransferase involved in cell wall biosynthesis
MSGLALFTSNFPYGNSETFLETEINFLSLNFEEIFIIPSSGKGNMRNLPGNVRVLSPLRSGKWSRLKIYLSGIARFYEVFSIPELRKEMENFSYLKCLKYYGYALLTKKQVEKRIPSGISVFYSYWLDFNAFSLSLLKKEGKIKTCISRAHGFDLYDTRGEKSLSFIRAATLRNLDRICFISNHGMHYLATKYPEYSNKYSVFRLGTSDPIFANPVPGNEFLTIVSCSSINPNKRINLILDSLIVFRNKYPSVKVKWYHYGTGKDIDRYTERIRTSFNESSVQCFFPGHLINQEIFEFYKREPVDFIINLSENEGIPVSIMEAYSHSIPAVATNVGGTSEIVNDENGQLISPDIDSGELADLFYNIYSHKENWIQKRSASRKWWEQNYNAEINYQSFSRELLTLMNR